MEESSGLTMPARVAAVAATALAAPVATTGIEGELATRCQLLTRLFALRLPRPVVRS